MARLPALVSPLAVLQSYFAPSDPVLHLRVNDWVYTATAIAGMRLGRVALLAAFGARATPRPASRRRS